MDMTGIIAARPRGDIITVTVDQTVRTVVAMLAERRIGAVPVMEAGRIAGIFSERDVLYRLAAEGEACLDRPVAEAMTSPPITAGPRTAIDDGLALMTRRRIRHLPICDGDEMVGFVSIGDLVKARYEEVRGEALAMREYIRTA